MSVADPVVSLWDGANRRIYLAAGVTDYYPIEDLYHEYRHQRRTVEDFRKWAPLLRAEGNVPKGAGAFTPRYVVLIDGTKIVPFDESLQLNQLGDMITDDPDTDPTLYDVSQLTTAKPIFIKPSEAETIQLNSDQIEYSSFSGKISIDVLSSNTLDNNPLAGNTQYPVNNVADAHIQAQRGFDTYGIIGDIAFVNGDDISYKVVIGQNASRSLFDIQPGADTYKAEFREAVFTGTLDGDTILRNGIVAGLNYVNGVVFNCMLSEAADIVLGGISTDVANFIDCSSGVPGSLTPTIDCNGDSAALAIRGFKGGVLIKNKTGTAACSLDFLSGQLKIDPSCTNGVVVARGTAKVIDAVTGEHMGSGTYNGNLTLINECVSGEHIHDTWEMMGLDRDRPMTISQQRHESAGLRVNITSNPDGTVTLHRQP